MQREDIPFMYNLRHNNPSSHLLPLPEGIEHQYAYFDKYLTRLAAGEEVYYVLHDKQKRQDVGVFRITELLGKDHCNWQSLIVSDAASPQVGVDICQSVYALAFDLLDRRYCGPWIINKNFHKMIRIHALMKMAKPISEDGEFYNYQVDRSDYEAQAAKFRAMSFGKVKGLHDD